MYKSLRDHYVSLVKSESSLARGSPRRFDAIRFTEAVRIPLLTLNCGRRSIKIQQFSTAESASTILSVNERAG